MNQVSVFRYDDTNLKEFKKMFGYIWKWHLLVCFWDTHGQHCKKIFKFDRAQNNATGIYRCYFSYESERYYSENATVFVGGWSIWIPIRFAFSKITDCHVNFSIFFQVFSGNIKFAGAHNTTEVGVPVFHAIENQEIALSCVAEGYDLLDISDGNSSFIIYDDFHPNRTRLPKRMPRTDGLIDMTISETLVNILMLWRFLKFPNLFRYSYAEKKLVNFTCQLSINIHSASTRAILKVHGRFRVRKTNRLNLLFA